MGRQVGNSNELFITIPLMISGLKLDIKQVPRLDIKHDMPTLSQQPGEWDE